MHAGEAWAPPDFFARKRLSQSLCCRTGRPQSALCRKPIVLRLSLLLAILTACPALAQDRAAIEAGHDLYEMHCASCHGERMVTPGSAFDLRKLHPNEKGRFDAVVLNGKGTQMPPWQGTLGPEEIDQLWAYVRENAYD
jgi:mono/diheme cytochrome c family protein